MPRRAAVLRGTVLDRTGAPPPWVTIAILNHPEFGQTLSRADGMFDLAVNGGGPLTVRYERAGLLAAQRRVNVPWQDYTILPEVILIPVDPQVTPITLGVSAPLQVARGSRMSDADGTRQATLLFPQARRRSSVCPMAAPSRSVPCRYTPRNIPSGPHRTRGHAGRPPATSAYTYAVDR